MMPTTKVFVNLMLKALIFDLAIQRPLFCGNKVSGFPLPFGPVSVILNTAHASMDIQFVYTGRMRSDDFTPYIGGY